MENRLKYLLLSAGSKAEKYWDKVKFVSAGLMGLSLMWIKMPGIVRRFWERQLFFRPTRLCDIHLIQSDELREKITPLSMFLRDGSKTKLSAWYIPAANPAKPTVVFLHGRACNIGDLELPLQKLSDRGYGVLAVDYPGYGDSQGRPSEENVYAAGYAACMDLADKPLFRIPFHKQIIMGHSMGGGVATQVAKRISEEAKRRGVNGPAGLVLINTFTNVRDTFDHRKNDYNKLLQKLFRTHKLQLGFDSLNIVKNDLKLPTMVIHGRKDNVTDFRMGETLYQAASTANPDSVFIPLDDVDHNLEGVFQTNGDKVMNALDAFADQAQTVSARRLQVAA